ncbi:hypothetical protein P3S68_004491 [Capsicum galapagoense]
MNDLERYNYLGRRCRKEPEACTAASLKRLLGIGGYFRPLSFQFCYIILHRLIHFLNYLFSSLSSSLLL